MTITITTDAGIEETFDVDFGYYGDDISPCAKHVSQDGKNLPLSTFSEAEIERMEDAVHKKARDMDNEHAWDKMIDRENERDLR